MVFQFSSQRQRLSFLSEVLNYDGYDGKKNREKIVGHLLREISRPTKSLLVRGAVIHVEILSVKYKNSPLVQEGLELSCKVYQDK